ncbi:MAG: transporter substrate-binding domain-containing protein, partial [Candidatus Auribacterota bacterium]|nr:transporter substrate-binding domain-containing protein [Candidatus Auribacterota bacterium]
LIQRSPDSCLPRRGSPVERERQLAGDFARSLGLKPVLVYLDDFEDLIPALLKGEGDLIAANLTVTESRKKKLSFTLPLDYSREQVVARVAEKKIAKISDLSGRIVGAQEGTSFLETLTKLSKQYPGIEIKILAGSLTDDEILDLVASETLDLVVADSNVLDAALTYRTDIKPVLDLTGEQSIAWAVRPDNPELLKALNNFLEIKALSGHRDEIYRDDLHGIRKRKTLRLLTTNNATNYFLLRGKLLGFEYELVKKFAEQLNLRLEVVVVPAYDQLIPWLLEGRGDLIAAFMTISQAREDKGIRFSRPSHYAEEMLVARSDEKDLKAARDLTGRTVVVRPASSYRVSLKKLQAEGVELTIGNAPETMTTEEIIDRVATGDYDLTAADTQILAIEESYRDDIKGVFPISKKVAQGWAVRKDDTNLLVAINKFLKKEYRGLFYNITYKKYFSDPKKVRDVIEEYNAVMKDGEISPYDELIKKYSEQYGFIWRLIAAQMYQESKFNPRAKSWVGAKGLMQVMPKTGKEFGFTRLEVPAIGIHAGVKYMDWVRERFGDKPDLLNRIWFSLAAYNAGIGHLNDARRLAGQKGWSPLAWFDNVDKAMLLLARPEYSKKARYGYVRGSEPVKYVRSISDRYHAYQSLAAASAEEDEMKRRAETKKPPPASDEVVPVRLPETTPPPAAPVVEPSPPDKEDIGSFTLYTVRPGDTLSRIARKVYGRSAPWKPIFNANRDQLKSPHNLKVGQVLKIPDGE